MCHGRNDLLTNVNENSFTGKFITKHPEIQYGFIHIQFIIKIMCFQQFPEKFYTVAHENLSTSIFRCEK